MPLRLIFGFVIQLKMRFRFQKCVFAIENTFISYSKSRTKREESASLNQWTLLNNFSFSDIKTRALWKNEFSYHISHYSIPEKVAAYRFRNLPLWKRSVCLSIA